MGEIRTVHLRLTRNVQYYNIIFQTRLDLHAAIEILDLTRQNLQLC